MQFRILLFAQALRKAGQTPIPPYPLRQTLAGQGDNPTENRASQHLQHLSVLPGEPAALAENPAIAANKFTKNWPMGPRFHLLLSLDLAPPKQPPCH